MHVKDANGDDHSFTLDAGTKADTILDLTGVDILEPEQQAQEIQRMVYSARRLRDVLWVCHDKTATTSQKTKGEFFSLFNDWEGLRESFLDELVNFTQGISPLAATRLEEMRATQERAVTKVKSYLQSDELKKAIDKELEEGLAIDMVQMKEKVALAMTQVNREKAEEKEKTEELAAE